MPGSILTRIPRILNPPNPYSFAHFSALTLFGFMCTTKFPRHPLFIVAWACSSYCLHAVWIKLKFKQIKATIEETVSEYLETKGACEDCRKHIFERGPEEFVNVFEDLDSAHTKATAAAERGEGAAEDGPEQTIQESSESGRDEDEDESENEDEVAILNGGVKTQGNRIGGHADESGSVQI